MKSLIRRVFLPALLVLASAGAAFAQLSIEITGAGANRLPVLVADFALAGGDATTAKTIAGVVRVCAAP